MPDATELHLDRIPANTAVLLEIFARYCPDIARYALIGGTGLALQTGHRISEDLDFSIGARELDRHAISQILETLDRLGLSVVDTMSEVAREEAMNEGEDLDGIQRDFAVSGGAVGSLPVKLTFVIHGAHRADTDYLKAHMADCTDYGFVKVASVETIFASKCAALADRMKSRDLFDLWWMTHKIEKPWAVSDIFATAQALRPGKTYEELKARLCSWPIPRTDEGFTALIDDDVTIETIRDNFAADVRVMEKALFSESRPLWVEPTRGAIVPDHSDSPKP